MTRLSKLNKTATKGLKHVVCPLPVPSHLCDRTEAQRHPDENCLKHYGISVATGDLDPGQSNKHCKHLTNDNPSRDFLGVFAEKLTLGLKLDPGSCSGNMPGS